MPLIQRKHYFKPFGNTDINSSCVQCGMPQSHTIHHLVEKDELKDENHPLLQPIGKSLPIQKPEERIERDELFMQVAELFALRSTCTRGNIGAVIVKEGRIISSGYNGAPPGMKHCSEVGCEVGDEELGCQRTIHAEANALIFAARTGVPTIDSIMYCTHSPCAACARLLIAAGISKLFYRNAYRRGRLDLLDEACVMAQML